ncbi:hypothetical protein MKK68_03785 [Methylobacterium sp. E-016]|uniref:hypothetical protein n=1 Tax=Methylobacterium sp. E-016 TaxID=2836556 RepID=UPI001FBB1F86|nr:hypothetical protein [Methylobacterium sp. E-016]MCJ2074773.1 hypothetical protein [Methylobacterium sp. E-016]
MAAHVNKVGFPRVVVLAVDPILAAIDLHGRSWSLLANAAPGDVDGAALVQRGALAALLGTPCTTPAGARRLLLHLRAALASNGCTLHLDPLAAGLVAARAADLALLLGLPGARAPIPLGEAAATVVHALNRAGAAALAYLAPPH